MEKGRCKMGEEKKENKGSKKLKYEVPRLVKIGDVTAKGECWAGSSDNTSCGTGGAALVRCEDGSLAINFCSTGGQE
jgi:hypothetical protein